MATRTALLIGNSSFVYSNQLPPLESPIQDVKSLSAVLKREDIGGFDQVEERVNLDYHTLREELANFFYNRQRDDFLLLYYSGHGKLNHSGKLFLTAVDTDPDRLNVNGISSRFLSELMEECRAKTIILLLDCCYSGAFARDGSKSGVNQDINAKVQFDGGSGRAILTATSSTQLAWTGEVLDGEIQPSLFTRFLVQGLDSGEADRDKNGLITLDEWYEYAYEKVLANQQSHKPMTPSRWIHEQEGASIQIARNPQKITAVLPNYVQIQIESPDFSKRLQAIVTLCSIAQQSDKLLAEAALQAIKNLSKDPDSIVNGAAIGALVSLRPDLLLPTDRVGNDEAFYMISAALKEERVQVEYLTKQNTELNKRLAIYRTELQKANGLIENLKQKNQELKPEKIKFPDGFRSWPTLEISDLSGISVAYDSLQGTRWESSVLICDVLGEPIGYLIIKCISAEKPFSQYNYNATSFSLQLFEDGLVESGAMVESTLLSKNHTRYERFNKTIDLVRGNLLSLSSKRTTVDVNVFECSRKSGGYETVEFHLLAINNGF